MINRNIKRGMMMNPYADLHTHSTASDGLFSPREVVEYAKKKELSAVAITDHDAVGGCREAVETGKKLGIEVVPGVEISTLYDDIEIHMLGLWIDPSYPSLLKILEQQRNIRAERNKMVIKLLNQLGIPISLDEVLKKGEAQGKEINVGRPHIAEVLVDKGFAVSIGEAFDLYLARGKMAYATPDRISPLDAIHLIHEAGGVAIVAHPGIYDRDELLLKLVSAGLDGIEYSHPDHNEEEVEKYLAFAKEHQILVSAGSDFHGARQNIMYHADLGTCTVTQEEFEALKAKRPI